MLKKEIQNNPHIYKHFHYLNFFWKNLSHIDEIKFLFLQHLRLILSAFQTKNKVQFILLKFYKR